MRIKPSLPCASWAKGISAVISNANRMRCTARGAAKSEGLGAALLARIDSTDPNALIGLPLFRLIDFLRNEGVEIL